VVTGRAPATPSDGFTVVTLTVNRRPVEVIAERGRFRGRVVLSLGRNRITAAAVLEVFDVDHPRASPAPVAGPPSAPVRVQRRRGPGSGRLDLATALLVAHDHRSVYWLCGEADGCLKEPFCVRVTALRVDCAYRWRFESGDPVTCGLVVSVYRRANRLYSYFYRCTGRWNANVSRFIRPDIERAGRRYRIDERDADSIRLEINDPNRDGTPRFDVDHDVFIP
jgi:hypothetical protein